MQGYRREVEVRWSDLDPNFHLRHSVYYDWGAFVRLSFLNENGLTPELMRQNNLGPILFREECVFKREIVFDDSIDVTLQLSKSRRDNSRWTMMHEIWKSNDKLSAIITIDGAWIDTRLRKLTAPTTFVQQMFEAIPKAEGFIWVD